MLQLRDQYWTNFEDIRDDSVGKKIEFSIVDRNFEITKIHYIRVML